MTIVFDAEVTRVEEAFALHSVRHILRAWTRDHKTSPKPGKIKIGFGNSILLNGKRVGGYYLHGARLMAVSSGRRWSLPSLYHELCHMNYAQFDVDHKHKKWSWWNNRAKVIDRELRHCWFSWWWQDFFCTKRKTWLKRN